MITRRDLLRRIWAIPVALGTFPQAMKAEAAKKKKRKKKVLRATIPTFAGAPSGSYVVPNTRATATNFVLEYDDGSFQTVAADQYRVAPFSGYVVKRSNDESQTAVDWSTILSYPMYWTGTIANSNGRTTVTREALEFVEVARVNPIDTEGAIDLELAYNAFVDLLYAAGGAFAVDDRGITLVEGNSSTNKIRIVSADQSKIYAERYADYENVTPSLTSRLELHHVDDTGNTQHEIVIDNGGNHLVAMTMQLDMDTLANSSVGFQVDNEFPLLLYSDRVALGKTLIVQTKTPSSAGDTGIAGEVCWDSNFIYVCVATNTWTRAAIASW